MTILEDKITKGLCSVLERRLERVAYHPLKGECDATHIADDDLYIGGEISMTFDNSVTLFLSWEENAGWDAHFSLIVSSSSNWNLGVLNAFDASDTPLWQKVIGKPLDAVECLGWDDTPHVVKFVFANESRFVGSSYQTRFGDGDDVFFCDVRYEPDLSGIVTIWSSGTEANNANTADAKNRAAD